MFTFLNRRKVFLLVAAAGAVACVAVIAALNAEFYWANRAHSHDRAVTALENLAVSIQRSVALKLESRKHDLEVIADLQETDGAERSLEEIGRVLPFGSVDADGHPIPNASHGLLLDVGASRFFSRLRDGPAAATIVGAPQVSLAPDSGLIVARRREAAGAFAGALISRIGPAELRDLLASYDLGDGGSVTLLNDAGRLVVSGTRATPPGTDFSQSPAFIHVMQAGVGAFDAKSQSDGRDRVYVVRRVPGAPVLVFVGTSLTTVYAPTRAVGEAEAITLCALVLLIVGFVSGSRREMRLRQASEHASRSAESVARHSEATLRTYFDNLSQGVLGVRVRGGRLEIERVNASAHRLLGVSETLLGRDPQEAFAARLPELLAELQQCLTSGRPAQRDFTVRVADRARTLRLTVTPVGGETDGDGLGGTRLLLANMEDVTLQESAQSQLLQSHRMDGIGRIASGVANEFNNLLQSMIGHLELLGDEVEPETVAGSHARSALNAAARGTRLTQGLLSSSSQQVLQPGRLDAAFVLEDVSDAFEIMRDRTVQVVIAMEPDVPDVFADAGHLQAALINLCQNGQEAMLPGGGTLTLRAYVRSALSALGQRTRNVVIRVTDEGHGMAPDIMARAREPFFTTKGERFRSGLGLSMADGFARQSGGELRLESSEGGGTSIEIWLPAAEAPIVEAPALDGQTVRVLLVEDGPEQRLFFKEVTCEAGFDVTAVPSAEEALTLLQSGQRFHLLVSDFLMPGLNGVELIGEALRHQPGLATLIMTGATDASLLAALPSTAGVLRKPFRTDQLLREMRQAIQSRVLA